ncbi:MAG TPA: hypothetical protein V6D21_23335 [Candidatus Obscuribacterales bacterium]
MNIPNNSSITITVAGKRVPVVFQDGNGRAIVPGSVERDIVLSFIGSALASPVTGLIVVIGSGYREIRLAVEGIGQEINTEIFKIRKQGEVDRMSYVYHLFGSKIEELQYSSYPVIVIDKFKESLVRKMEAELHNF